MGLGFAVELARLARAGSFLQCPQVFLDKALARPLDGGDASRQGLGNLFVRQSLSRFE